MRWVFTTDIKTIFCCRRRRKNGFPCSVICLCCLQPHDLSMSSRNISITLSEASRYLLFICCLVFSLTKVLLFILFNFFFFVVLDDWPWKYFYIPYTSENKFEFLFLSMLIVYQYNLVSISCNYFVVSVWVSFSVIM